MALLAVQQFQLRNVIHNGKQVRSTLQAVKDSGLEGIEVDAFLLEHLPLWVRLFAKMAGMSIGSSRGVDWPKEIHSAGLQVVALHEDLGTLEKNSEKVLALASSLGTKNIVITGLFRYDYSNEGNVLSLAGRLNLVGQALARQGYTLYYHNHNCEFRKCGEKTAFQVLLENTAPEYVHYEFDSYWCSECGADPLEWMDKLGRRMGLYHINDRGNRDGGKMPSITKSDSLELSRGNMPLNRLIQKAESYEVQAIIIETHEHWIHDDPIESMRLSAAYLGEQAHSFHK